MSTLKEGFSTTPNGRATCSMLCHSLSRGQPRIGQRALCCNAHDQMAAPVNVAGPVETVGTRDLLAVSIA
jgi:hypothetical protein